MTMSNFEMMGVVKNRVIELMIKFKEVYNNRCKYKVDSPKVDFLKKGTTAGEALFNPTTGEGRLSFNLILMRDNWNDFDQTVIHEVAHHCVDTMRGEIVSRTGRKRVIHGSDWKSMMRFFGVSPKRCHNYDTSNIKTKKGKKSRRWSYKCGCGTHNLSTIRHNRIRRGGEYTCNSCRQILKAA